MGRVISFLILVALAGLSARAAAAGMDVDYARSRVEVGVKSTVDSFTGRLEKYRVSVEWGPSDPLPAKARMSFDFADLKTGDTDRDGAMLKWLGHDSQPGGEFVLGGWRREGTTNLATGELTIHGVKREVAIPVVAGQTNGVWVVDGEALLDYRDFGLPKIRKALVLTVNPLLRVRFHVVAKAAVKS